MDQLTPNINFNQQNEESSIELQQYNDRHLIKRNNAETLGRVNYLNNLENQLDALEPKRKTMKTYATKLKAKDRY